jgi:hypothetical protein
MKSTSARETGDRLLLTEEEGMARMKTKDGSRSSSETHHGGRNGGGGKNRGGKARGNARAGWGAMMCVPIVARNAIGSRNVARRSAMRWPRLT